MTAVNASLASVIRAAAEEMKPQLLEWYRDLHRIPEIAHKEFKTNAYIRAALDRMGISYLAPKDNITIAVITADHSDSPIPI